MCIILERIVLSLLPHSPDVNGGQSAVTMWIVRT